MLKDQAGKKNKRNTNLFTEPALYTNDTTGTRWQKSGY